MKVNTIQDKYYQLKNMRKSSGMKNENTSKYYRNSILQKIGNTYYSRISVIAQNKKPKRTTAKIKNVIIAETVILTALLLNLFAKILLTIIKMGIPIINRKRYDIGSGVINRILNF